MTAQAQAVTVSLKDLQSGASHTSPQILYIVRPRLPASPRELNLIGPWLMFCPTPWLTGLA